MPNLKIIFLGTPEFAVPVLEKLVNNEFKPIAVFCAPDKPVGRKQTLTFPPTKILAQKNNIPVFQPANKTELAGQLRATGCDLVISAAYGIIIPKEALDLPQFGCLNIHPSLLPKYRGASPIQSAILNGDAESGVTIFKMDENMDTGLIIASNALSIASRQYTTPELSKELSELGANLLLEILPDWIGGKIIPKPQDDTLATYTKIIKKEDGRINWQKSAQEIERQIRAFDPWPGAFAYLKEEKIKIKVLKAKALEEIIRKQIGEIFLNKNEELSVQCGRGCLIIKNLQLEGGKPLGASSFLRGHKNIIGAILN